MNKRTYHKRGELVDGYSPRKHPNYPVWAGMKTRCSNTNAPGYRKYGARGITYCEEWEHFANFCRDMGVRPSPHHTLDRIDNGKGYFPGNCRWATRTQQCLNRNRFANNSTGVTGVVEKRGRYVARYNEGGKRYTLSGSFSSVEEAAQARQVLIARLARGEPVDDLVGRGARFDSATGHRGITKHAKGGYLVRVTHDGARHYVGFFTTMEAAIAARDTWIASKKS